MIPVTDITTAAGTAEGAVEGVTEEAGSAKTAIGDMGAEASPAAGQIVTAMGTAREAVKSLAEQFDEIMRNFGEKTESGRRELAFIVKLDRQAELRLEIEQLEVALKALANDTTINIDDQRVIDLQTSLVMARNELDMLAQQDQFKSKLQTAFRDLDMAAANSSAQLREVVKDLLKLQESNSITGEQHTYVNQLILEVMQLAELAEAAEQQMEDFYASVEMENLQLDGLIGLYDELSRIDKLLDGQNALQAKINAVNKAIEDGSISWLEGQEMIAGYRAEIDALEKEHNNFENTMKRMIATSFPNATAAFGSMKSAVDSFKNAFTGENGKPALKNIDEGLLSVRDSIMFAKAAMSEFGNVAGLAITGLEFLVPGLGSTITSVLSILNTLGIDVEAIIKRATDALLGFLGVGGGGPTGPLGTLFAMFDARKNEFGEKILAGGGDYVKFMQQPELMKQALSDAVDYDDFINRVAEAYGLTFEAAKNIFDRQLELNIKAIRFPGVYDPNTGERAYVSPELQAEIMAMLASLQSNRDLDAQDILDILLARYGRTALNTLGIAQMLGLPPLAQGGILSGATMALMGEYAGAQTNPEVIAPLNKLKDLLVTPTIDTIKNMMGSGMSQQVIYVTLDGRVLSQAVFEGLPDVVRMNTGGLQ
jgi:hypothetical protein